MGQNNRENLIIADKDSGYSSLYQPTYTLLS